MDAELQPRLTKKRMDWILPQNATYSTFRCLQCITFNKSKKPNEYYSLLFPQSQLEVDVGQHLLSLLLKVLANRKMVNTNEDTIQEYYQMVEYCISILHQVEAHHLVLLFQQIEILATELKVDTLNWMNGIAGEVEFRKLLVHLISMIKNCSLCSKGDVKVASMRIRYMLCFTDIIVIMGCIDLVGRNYIMQKHLVRT